LRIFLWKAFKNNLEAKKFLKQNFVQKISKAFNTLLKAYYLKSFQKLKIKKAFQNLKFLKSPLLAFS
jgi:hypothetical protein